MIVIFVTVFSVGKIDAVATFIGILPNFVDTFETRFASTKIVKPKLQNQWVSNIPRVCYMVFYTYVTRYVTSLDCDTR